VLFGVATADHQCEAYDGRDDIRDVWERARGLTPRGDATDFWNRYREDVDLAKALGCRAFRLSLSWARLETEPGVWSDDAFAHYRQVLQYMRDAGMATIVTLHHNTWPLHVQAAGHGGGMLDAGFPARLASYAAQVAQRLGDLVDYYLTLNEPNQLVYGYIKGFWMRAYAEPPGLPPFTSGEQQMDAVLRLIPNLFRAHHQARQAIQDIRPGAKVGTNPLVLGLPQWLQHLIDRNATHLRSPQHARRQAARVSQTPFLQRGRADIAIAQLAMSPNYMEHVLFSEPYYIAQVDERVRPYAVAVPIGSRALLNAVDYAVRDFKKTHPGMPVGHNRKTIADIGRPASANVTVSDVPDMDRSLQAIRRRGVLRVAIHPGIEGLCMPDGAGGYRGLEPDIARHIAKLVLGSEDAVQFIPRTPQESLQAIRSWLQVFDGLRKSIAMFGTLLGTNWWNLGMAGKLPQFLCPSECVGTLDYVGLDYYWGIPSIWPGKLERLAAASEFRYGSAPVWPGVLEQILRSAHGQFPGKPIIVIENGCVTSADGYTREKYLAAHIQQVRKAADHCVPIEAYLCWSITSNREWGLPFDDNSDFGLYHIDLDHDPNLKRVATPAAGIYGDLIHDEK